MRFAMPFCTTPHLLDYRHACLFLVAVHKYFQCQREEECHVVWEQGHISTNVHCVAISRNRIFLAPKRVRCAVEAEE